MMRGEKILPLSEDHEKALVTLSTGVLPDPGGLQDQDASFVDDLHRVRTELSRQAARRLRDRGFEIGG